MTTSPNGIKLIQHFESCPLEAYKDSKGVATVGFGNTYYEDGRPVKMGDTITQERADSLFKAILPHYELLVSDKVKRALLQHEFDALVSFCYNAGVAYKDDGGQWHPYDIWRLVQNKTVTRSYWETLAIKSGGKVINGLINRRKSESEMYFDGVMVV